MISGASEGETPHRSPPRAKIPSPAAVTRAAPSRRAAWAPGTAAAASTRLYATRTQITAFTETLKSRVDLGQRQDDDGGVGEHEPDGNRESGAERAG